MALMQWGFQLEVAFGLLDVERDQLDTGFFCSVARFDCEGVSYANA